MNEVTGVGTENSSVAFRGRHPSKLIKKCIPLKTDRKEVYKLIDRINDDVFLKKLPKEEQKEAIKTKLLQNPSFQKFLDKLTRGK